MKLDIVILTGASVLLVVLLDFCSCIVLTSLTLYSLFLHFMCCRLIEAKTSSDALYGAFIYKFVIEINRNMSVNTCQGVKLWRGSGYKFVRETNTTLSVNTCQVVKYWRGSGSEV